MYTQIQAGTTITFDVQNKYPLEWSPMCLRATTHCNYVIMPDCNVILDKDIFRRTPLVQSICKNEIPNLKNSQNRFQKEDNHFDKRKIDISLESVGLFIVQRQD